MRRGPHIHYAGDGRSNSRLVFLNGKVVEWVEYADTKAGVIRVMRRPFKVDKWGKRVLTRTLRGKVEVIEAPNIDNPQTDT